MTKKLQEKLTLSSKNVWEEINEKEREGLFKLNEDYKNFLDNSKTERKATQEIIRRAEAKGFISLDEILEKNIDLKTGLKIYATNKDKGVVLLVLGKEEITEGLNIIGSHIDSPRLDLKQNPLYEDSDLALFKTHYYGGIKKYQWVSLPLELHGVIIMENGEKINVSIGDEEDEPVFFISDLLIHLAKDQMDKKLSEGIEGEGLNIIVGSIPYKDNEISEKVKLNILNILNKKYGIKEEDFITAEIQAVPAGKSRDLGLDKSMVMGYGHDDRVCAYTSLKAILEVENPRRTSVALFMDKEEIGSVGNTGMESNFFENVIVDLVSMKSESSFSKIRKIFTNSMALSADVAAGYDPNYPEVLEKRNAASLGHGITIVKYTGSRGKGGCNDANPEFLAYIRKVFNEKNIIWQTGELGKVDQGGGGTIAYILANHSIEVVDCGIPVLGMHSPYEVVSKADVYMTYKGYKAFYLA